eukprot:13025037-Alexandrium_andersonii.AAC.1
MYPTHAARSFSHSLEHPGKVSGCSLSSCLQASCVCSPSNYLKFDAVLNCDVLSGDGLQSRGEARGGGGG